MCSNKTRLSMLLTATVLFVMPSFVTAQVASKASFNLIPVSIGNYHFTKDMSDSGVFVGRYTNNNKRAEGFLWHLDSNQFTTLGDLPGGSFYSEANGISADGAVIVGVSNSDKGHEAIRWTSTGEMQSLGLAALGINYSYASSVSSDGTIITGYGRTKNNNNEAYIWSATSGVQMLGYLPGGSLLYSTSDKISADGTTVVGKSSSNTGAQAFLWTKSGGMKGLGYLPGISQGQSTARDVSNDGSVIVGESTTPVNTKSVEAVRWTKSGDIQALGDLPGGDYKSIAYSVSGDGSIIAGTSISVSGYEAFIWDKENGMRSLNTVLESEGVSLGGWHIINVFTISYDGTLLTGIARDANHNVKSWTAILPNKRNAIPVANAGKDQNATRGNIVTLDGSASNDQDGDYPLTYQWSVVNKPADSAIILSDPVSVTPAFIPDVIGDYVLELIVTDNTGRSSEPDQVLVSTINAAPVANAGKDIAIILNGTVATLDGSLSSDPEGDAITYDWNMISRPTDSTAVLSDVAAVKPSFSADEHGDYMIQLTVTDEHGTISAPDTVAVSFTNLPPTANAGSDQKDVLVGDTVELTGSGEDPNNDHPLSYEWKMVSWPTNNAVLLASTNGVNTSFTPDIPGTYVLELIASDGHLKSEPDSVVVSVISVETALYNAMAKTADTITGLNPDVFKKHKHQNALLNKLASVLGKIDKKKYKSAYRHLKKDILRKTNGCSKRGKPDRRDWIIECDAQAKVQAAVENVLTLLYRLAPDIKIKDHDEHKHHQRDRDEDKLSHKDKDDHDRHEKKDKKRRR